VSTRGPRVEALSQVGHLSRFGMFWFGGENITQLKTA